jgi:putative flippase GtrA
MRSATLIRAGKFWQYFTDRKSTIWKFAIVSGSAVLLNLFLLYVLVRYLGFASPCEENIANVIAMELSIIYNFFLSRTITWRDRNLEQGRMLLIQIIKFHATIGITILFRMGLFALLQHVGIYYIVNAAIGIAISALFNFVVYDALIFKRRHTVV